MNHFKGLGWIEFFKNNIFSSHQDDTKTDIDCHDMKQGEDIQINRAGFQIEGYGRLIAGQKDVLVAEDRPAGFSFYRCSMDDDIGVIHVAGNRMFNSGEFIQI